MEQAKTGRSVPRKPMRADARRNYDRLLAVASEVVAQQGADASLEEIARRAGVGSATLHRHFPGRQALLEAVFRDRVDTLCALAHHLLAQHEPGDALAMWLRALVAHATANRGLGASLMMGAQDPDLGASAHAMILEAGGSLLAHAQRDRSVRPEVAIADLLQLVNAVAVVTERAPDPAGQGERLLDLVINGLKGPRGA